MGLINYWKGETMPDINLEVCIVHKEEVNEDQLLSTLEQEGF